MQPLPVCVISCTTTVRVSLKAHVYIHSWNVPGFMLTLNCTVQTQISVCSKKYDYVCLIAAVLAVLLNPEIWSDEWWSKAACISSCWLITQILVLFWRYLSELFIWGLGTPTSSQNSICVFSIVFSRQWHSIACNCPWIVTFSLIFVFERFKYNFLTVRYSFSG